MKYHGEINWDKFGAAILHWRERRHLSVREAAYETGLSHSTIRRVERGKPAEAGHYLRLCDWMGLAPYRYYEDQPSEPPKCTECKHYFEDDVGNQWCERRGDRHEMTDCAVERSTGPCGRNARMFKTKENSHEHHRA